MTWDGTTVAALIALIIVSVLLIAALRQALGERGRAGVGRIVDGIAAVIITMRGTREKEGADVSERSSAR